MTADELLFFNDMPGAVPLYDALRSHILSLAPETAIEVKKTQITFRARYGFAFVSLGRMKGCPEVYLILTLGLERRLSSPRAAVAVEPYPGRWTHHFIISAVNQLDEELLGWLREAHDFAQRKSRRK
ncbi:DUF5655 domain-containing protein [Vermiculatibacterium agrestimuris]|uniref:DUF5655 domain-containing protein n=1 Tax=Vermiculatibacterium agrestimuris TaxID=2941519 RepID=UPI00203BB741|nr:DUF5655 domain-containing protein [Vermiculatibacterium agrestimuris]